MPSWLGAHRVDTSHAWSVARVRSVTQAIILALAMGVWVLVMRDHLFLTPAWHPLYELLNGQVAVVGVIILLGGVLGVLGLVTRVTALSILSSILCLAWFAWVGGFLWWSNFNGAANIGSFLCFYGFGEYAYRIVLLAPRPKAGNERIVGGW